jgi:glycosyltransferase involved in cell wall biosynthesis
LFGHVLDPEIRLLANQPEIRERVRLVGHRIDASELISGADVFVMPSRAEALSQALLEAMYQRVCPVVSDAGGMKEVVRHGCDGIVVPVANVDALVQAIQTLYDDRTLVARFAAAAHQRIAESFTPENMAQRCLTIYQELLGQGQCRDAA